MRIRSISAIRTLGWPAWIASLLLFAGLCAVAAYWAAVLLAPRAPIAPTGVVADPRALPELQQSEQLFGLTQAVVAAAKLANVQVVGIVAAGRRGSAILGIDGKPARAYAVGESLTPSQRLSAVESDRVVIANNGRLVELPVPSNASLDVLSSGANQPPRQDAPAGGTPLPEAPRGAIVPVPGSAAPRIGSLPPGVVLPPGGVPVVPTTVPVSGIVPVNPDQESAPGQGDTSVPRRPSE